MFLLFIGTVMVGFAFGVAAGVMVRSIAGNQDLGNLVGTGVWLFSWNVMHVYGFAWLFDPALDRLDARGEGKLQTAEVRIGVVWAMIGGGLAMAAKASTLQVALFIIPCAIIGGLLGHDVKRRVQRKQAQHRQVSTH